MWILALGILVNSALYLTGCFVAGMLIGNGAAWRLSVAAAGFTYLSYLGQYDRRVVENCYWLAQALVVLSIVLGALAGLSLLA